MRSGAAACHHGYFHETAFYSSDDELLAIVEPFLRGGQEAGEPTLVTFGERNALLVQEHIRDLDGIEFVSGDRQYRNPAQTIADYRARFAKLTAEGAGQIRVVGDVPHPGVGVSWEGWARYEAAINHAYDDFPLWGMCPYDTRITPDYVLDEVRRTHPHVATADGLHSENPGFVSPAEFLRGRSARDFVAAESGEPLLALTDVTSSAARAAIGNTVGRALDRESLERFTLAVSEVVGNAERHGEAPVEMRLWAEGDNIVAKVSDAGPGPEDPCVGLMPREGDPFAGGGRGLWIAHQLCTDVSLSYQEGSFSVRMLLSPSR